VFDPTPHIVARSTAVPEFMRELHRLSKVLEPLGYWVRIQSVDTEHVNVIVLATAFEWIARQKEAILELDAGKW
jgi:hypothetical protein